jgi:hypothetical protein
MIWWRVASYSGCDLHWVYWKGFSFAPVVDWELFYAGVVAWASREVVVGEVA